MTSPVFGLIVSLVRNLMWLYLVNGKGNMITLAGCITHVVHVFLLRCLTHTHMQCTNCYTCWIYSIAYTVTQSIDCQDAHIYTHTQTHTEQFAFPIQMRIQDGLLARRWERERRRERGVSSKPSSICPRERGGVVEESAAPGCIFIPADPSSLSLSLSLSPLLPPPLSVCLPADADWRWSGVSLPSPSRGNLDGRTDGSTKVLDFDTGYYLVMTAGGETANLKKTNQTWERKRTETKTVHSNAEGNATTSSGCVLGAVCGELWSCWHQRGRISQPASTVQVNLQDIFRYVYKYVYLCEFMHLCPGPPQCALRVKTRLCPSAVCHCVYVELLQLKGCHNILYRYWWRVARRVRDVLVF